MSQPRIRGVITLKSPEQIARMREAGRVVAAVLRLMRERVRPGVSTAELDALAEREIERHGATSSFKGYYGYPAVICTSVNEEVVHGIPSDRALRAGDIVGIDAGAIIDGWHGDAAITLPVGRVSPEAARLIDTAREALRLAIASSLPGRRLGDVGAAVQRHAEAQGFSVVRNYVGHGIGRAMHEEPQVPNYGEPDRGPVLKEGLCLALEPMLTAGAPDTAVLEDRWTVVTADGSLAAHFEHTVAVTAAGPLVLTAEAA